MEISMDNDFLQFNIFKVWTYPNVNSPGYVTVILITSQVFLLSTG
jgi:hypothetical protein